MNGFGMGTRPCVLIHICPLINDFIYERFVWVGISKVKSDRMGAGVISVAIIFTNTMNSFSDPFSISV